MANSRSRKINVQEEPRKHCHTRKQGSYYRSVKKASGGALRKFPLAKAEIILTSVRIISARN